MFSKDQLGRLCSIETPPRRLVSLVPSLTELLIQLNSENRLVGCTKFCIHPKSVVSRLCKVGGTKTVSVTKVLDLKPDLIIANKEENTAEIIAALETQVPVWVSDIKTPKDYIQLLQAWSGTVLNNRLTERHIAQFQKMLEILRGRYKPVRVAYLIWNKPMMLAGSSTFISNWIEHLGWINVAAHLNRYPEINMEALKDLNPEVILLSSEPFPFKKSHIGFFKNHFPHTKIAVVDGAMFSWYGTRLMKWKTYANSLERLVNFEKL